MFDMGIKAESVELLRLYMRPPAGSRARRIYVSQGLSGRRVGRGTYRVRREDEQPLDQFPVQVQIASPWADQLTATVVTNVVEKARAGEGDEGEGSESGLEVVHEVVQAPRWLALVVRFDKLSVLVRIYAIPRLSQKRKKSSNLAELRSWQQDRTGPSDGAGFCLMTWRTR